MDPQILMQINEIYRNEVYAEPKPADINQWVSQLISEGYDLDDYSDEELYEAYLEDLDEARVDDNKSRLQKEIDRSKRHGSAPHYFPGNLDNQTAARTSDHEKQRGVTKVMAGLPAREMSGAPDLFNYKNRFNEPRPSDGGKRVGPQKTADQYGRFAKNMKNVPPEEKSKTIKAIKKSILKRPRVRVPLPEELDLYDIVSEYLVSEGFCDSYEDADVIMANMSEEWRESIVEEVLDEVVGFGGKIDPNTGKWDTEAKPTPAQQRRMSGSPTRSSNVRGGSHRYYTNARGYHSQMIYEPRSEGSGTGLSMSPTRRAELAAKRAERRGENQRANKIRSRMGI